MNEVERKLSPRNRDKFTQNVTIFRRDINGQSIIAPSNIVNPFASLF